ncbi:MAG: hypothetical protein NTW03_18085 [Verrucomicrobia bacterium]|nr:hypothetical protein [Verrucomicrobiota bacterium]
MVDPQSFLKLALPGGFVIVGLELTDEPMVDALGREAVAQTRITGREFRLRIRSGLAGDELSITLYHEILEAATVASLAPPASLAEFNEAAFERAALEAHQRWGDASPANVDRLLQFHGFGRE